jgi:hypothetical protein
MIKELEVRLNEMAGCGRGCGCFAVDWFKGAVSKKPLLGYSPGDEAGAQYGTGPSTNRRFGRWSTLAGRWSTKRIFKHLPPLKSIYLLRSYSR